MKKEEFIKIWDNLSLNKRFVLSSFLKGKCFVCEQAVSPSSLHLRGEFTYHMMDTHGLRRGELVNVLNNFWSE